jgi:hypothetical protein
MSMKNELKWEDAKCQTFVVVKAYIVVGTVCRIKKDIG